MNENNQSGQFSWKTEASIMRPLFQYHPWPEMKVIERTFSACAQLYILETMQIGIY